jgi:hypothetical protein
MVRAFRIPLLAAAAVALVSTACTTETVYDDYNMDTRLGGNLLDLPLDGAHLAGDIGPVTGVDAAAEVNQWDDSWDGYRYETVNLDVYGDRTWAMIGVTFDGGLDHADLQRGETLTFDNSAGFYNEPGMYEEPGNGAQALSVQAIGCSSDDSNNPFEEGYFDEPAETVEVTVSEGPEPDLDRVDVVVAFSDGQLAHGAFTRPAIQ